MPKMTRYALDDPHRHITFRYFHRELSTVNAVVFLFHGRGGNADSVMASLGEKLLTDDVLFIAPDAAQNCWYPYRFNEPVSVNQPWLDSAIEAIHREVEELIEKGMDAKNFLFGGFSQGSCLAIEYVSRYPKRYGGVFCLSGGLIGPEGSREPLPDAGLHQTPVFLGSADVDDWIPLSKFKETEHFLVRSNAVVDARIYPDIGHSICDEEFEETLLLIKRALRSTTHPKQQQSIEVAMH